MEASSRCLKGANSVMILGNTTPVCMGIIHPFRRIKADRRTIIYKTVPD